MDPLSHAVTGAAIGALVSGRPGLRAGLIAGALAGMAPDLDIFLRSETDPLLHLEFHRGFTHSLFFGPILALASAAIFHPFVRSRLPFARNFLVCLAAIWLHGLLDAATSYGTSLYWPFSDARVGWNMIAVIDPLYTAPALGLVAATFFGCRLRWSALALLWMGGYVALGGVQRERAQRAIEAEAQRRGHSAVAAEAKPSIFNQVVFRTVYRVEDSYFVDAVRVGYFGSVKVYPGSEVPVFDRATAFPDLPAESRLARDIERFGHFSMGFLYQVPGNPEIVADLRYALVPNAIDPLWGILVDPARAEEHAPFETFREVTPERRDHFRRMLLGQPLP
ncbi:MAG: metal-dependent hydrolase [Opitutales bacterium]|nr:metal-dependent hydrolase [Opitutales bacterium]